MSTSHIYPASGRFRNNKNSVTKLSVTIGNKKKDDDDDDDDDDESKILLKL